jgi:hypothetical protein
MTCAGNGAEDTEEEQVDDFHGVTRQLLRGLS